MKRRIERSLAAATFISYCILFSIKLQAQQAPSSCPLEYTAQLKAAAAADSVFCYQEIGFARMAKTKLWGVYVYSQERIAPQFDSIVIPAYSNATYALGWKNKKVKALNLYSSKQVNKLETEDMIIEVDTNQNEYLKVKVKGKWGQADIRTGKIIIPFEYDKSEDFTVRTPEFDFLFGNELELRASLKADKIIFYDNKETGVMYARSKANGQWGLFQKGSKKVLTLIPMSYDSIQWRVDAITPFTFVWNNGKAGTHGLYPAGPNKALVDCMYDDGKITMDVEGIHHFIARKNGKWGLVDWYNGEVITDFTYSTAAEVPISYDKRSSWYK